jgi:hypothetical protein
MEPYWSVADSDPSNPDYDIEFARIWQSKPTYVFSRTAKSVSGNATLINSDVADAVARLKATTAES